jgi:hypothetical protein
MINARKLGMPLALAAEMVSVPADIAQLWLNEGRRLLDLGRSTGRKLTSAAEGYRRRCIELARGWDSASAGTIVVLRGLLFDHARKDPKVCAQYLAVFEREYDARQPEPQGREGDLAEAFKPLSLPELGGGRGAGGGAAVRLTHTAADGSRTTAELGVDEFDDRSDEELEYYANHGVWPAVARALPAGAVIDTEGEEEHEPEPTEALAEELAAELAGTAPEEPSPATPMAWEEQRRRTIDALRELGQREVVESAPAQPEPEPEPPASAPFPHLRRVDPLARR